jgi:hypothetical protein
VRGVQRVESVGDKNIASTESDTRARTFEVFILNLVKTRKSRIDLIKT